uniref:Ig-like domain-containing protein n=1 Tax=Pygocentrus nattereri TaxID=42514 RepID=A0AAR2K1G6_PYGNA
KAALIHHFIPTGKPTPTVRVDPQSSVYTGDTVTLTCEVESTGWEFLWYKDSQPIQPQSPVDKETNTVRVTVSDKGRTEFKCAARRKNYFDYSYQRYDGYYYDNSKKRYVYYNVYKTHRSAPVVITVTARPKATVTIHPADPVFTGERVTLTCHIGSGDGWYYEWFKDGKSLSEAGQRKEYTISKVAESHGGVYTCNGTQSTQPSYSDTSDAVTLTVSALPTATLTVEPKWSPVFTGESVTLKCEIQSYSDWRYQWYKGSSRTAVSQSQTNTFTIRSAADQDQGQYWCRGERDDRPSSSQDSNTVTLTVKERPRAVVSIQPGDQVFIGETVTLRCDIQGGGVSNWQYSWFKDDSSTPVSNEQQYRIGPVTESHRGKYTCGGTERGTSRYSHTSDDVTLTVSGE